MSRYSMIFHDIEGLWRNNLASSHPPEPFQTFIQVAFLYQSSTRGWTSVHRLLAGCTENLGTPWNTYSTNSKTIQTIPNHPEPFQQQHIKSFNLSKKSKTFKDHFNKVPLKKIITNQSKERQTVRFSSHIISSSSAVQVPTPQYFGSGSLGFAGFGVDMGTGAGVNSGIAEFRRVV